MLKVCVGIAESTGVGRRRRWPNYDRAARRQLGRRRSKFFHASRKLVIGSAARPAPASKEVARARSGVVPAGAGESAPWAGRSTADHLDWLAERRWRQVFV